MESAAEKQRQKINGVKYSDLSWAEQPHTIHEIGSTYTVQGFDLNHVGVVIGPSVKYRDGKVIFDPSASANKKAVQRRTMKDHSKQRFGEQLLHNELNVFADAGRARPISARGRSAAAGGLKTGSAGSKT